MNIVISRLRVVDGLTFGSLRIDGVWECYTKEAGIVRPDGYLICGESIPPLGRYNVQMVLSRIYKRQMPVAMCTGTSEGARPRLGFYFSPGHHTPNCGAITLGQTQTEKDIGRTKIAASVFTGKVVKAIQREEAVDLEIE